MTKIETLVKLIDQSSINCHGVDCRECPFDGLANDRISCALLDLNDANAEDITIKKAIIAAVDEARKEEVDPKTGEWWRLKGDDRYLVKVVDGDYQLLGRRIVKYKNGCNATLGTNIEDFLERFEKEDGPIMTLGEDTELIKPSHTTPEHYKLDPEPIAVIKAWDLGFCLGNVLKYIARAGHKAGESRDKDLHKAMEYLRMELEDQADAKESTAARRCC